LLPYRNPGKYEVGDGDGDVVNLNLNLKPQRGVGASRGWLGLLERISEKKVRRLLFYGRPGSLDWLDYEARSGTPPSAS
jgi:hypothetical protein